MRPDFVNLLYDVGAVNVWQYHKLVALEQAQCAWVPCTAIVSR